MYIFHAFFQLLQEEMKMSRNN